jgi:hypothetical protein
MLEQYFRKPFIRLISKLSEVCLSYFNSFLIFTFRIESDAKAGGATNAAKAMSRLKMNPNEAMKILDIEKHELSRTLLNEVSSFLIMVDFSLLRFVVRNIKNYLI